MSEPPAVAAAGAAAGSVHCFGGDTIFHSEARSDVHAQGSGKIRGSGKIMLAEMARLAMILSLSLCGPVAGFPATVGLRSLAPGRQHAVVSGQPVQANSRRGACQVRPAHDGATRRARPLCLAQVDNDLEGTKTLIRRLENNLDDLTALRVSVASEVDELQASLAEKKASLTLIDDRLERVAAEIQNARSEVRIASTEIAPATIVGDGRVGQMLKAKGDKSDVMVRSTSEMKFQLKKNPGGSGADGPIYLCVPNSALDELVEACPEDRRQDLVFMGSGNLGDFLEDKGLQDCSQALIYFVISKLGEDPVDGVTDLDPDGLTCAVGKWAPDLAKRLRQVNMSCKILTPEQFEVSRAERLVWTCSVHLVAKANDLRTIGAVVPEPFWKQTEDCMRELAATVHSTTVIAVILACLS